MIKLWLESGVRDIASAWVWEFHILMGLSIQEHSRSGSYSDGVTSLKACEGNRRIKALPRIINITSVQTFAWIA